MKRKATRTLASAGATAMIAVGIGGVVFPEASARGYGVSANSPQTIAYVRAAALRDITLGVVLLRAARNGGLRALRTTLLCVAVVPLADLAIVAAHGRDPRRLILHAAGTAAIGLVWALTL